MNSTSTPPVDQKVLPLPMPYAKVEVLDVQSLCTRDACIVRLYVWIQDNVYEFSGTSRRHPEDKANSDVAYMLAYARAYESFAHRLNKRAKGLVKHHDDAQITSMKARSPEAIKRHERWIRDHDDHTHTPFSSYRINRRAIPSARDSKVIENNAQITAKLTGLAESFANTTSGLLNSISMISDQPDKIQEKNVVTQPTPRKNSFLRKFSSNR